MNTSFVSWLVMVGAVASPCPLGLLHIIDNNDYWEEEDQEDQLEDTTTTSPARSTVSSREDESSPKHTTSKPRKSVKFSGVDWVVLIPSHNDYDDITKTKIWWSVEDYDNFTKAAEQLSNMGSVVPCDVS